MATSCTWSNVVIATQYDSSLSMNSIVSETRSQNTVFLCQTWVCERTRTSRYCKKCGSTFLNCCLLRMKKQENFTVHAHHKREVGHSALINFFFWMVVGLTSQASTILGMSVPHSIQRWQIYVTFSKSIADRSVVIDNECIHNELKAAFKRLHRTPLSLHSNHFCHCDLSCQVSATKWSGK